MNPAVAGLAVRHGGHALRRVVGTFVAVIVFGAVAITGGLAGIGIGGLDLASAGSAATLSTGATAVAISTSGPDLSVAQIGGLAEGAGFSGSGLAMAIAVALAESGGNPTAINYDSNGTVDRGIWQINSVHTQYSTNCVYDPACNAGAAFAISAGGADWNAWVTYQHGAEIPFLPEAVSFAEGAGATS